MSANVSASDIDLADAARSVITGLFAKYEIGDATQAHRLVRERFTQADLETYRDAVHVLDGMGALG